MRIAAAPSIPANVRASAAVAPAGSVRSTRQREPGAAVSRSRRRESRAAAAEPFVLSPPVAGSVSTTLAGIVAQGLFHARFGGRPEESTIHAARAYLRTSDLSFAEARSTLRVA